MADDWKQLPQIGDNAIPGQLGEALVQAAVLELGHLYHPRSGLDFGIDGTIEIVRKGIDGKEQATGRQIGVQVKRGLSVVQKTRYGWTLYCSPAHANYWLGHSLPIIVVFCEPGTGRLRWTQVKQDTLRPTSKGFALDIADASDLSSAARQLAKLADAQVSHVGTESHTLIIPYDFRAGVTAPEQELGLAALEACRAAVRGEPYKLQIEVEGEADLIADIDAIRDVEAPTDDQRREAVGRRDILHNYRRHARKLERVLTLLLSEARLAEHFGYNEREVVHAVLNAAPPSPSCATVAGDVHMQAWPAPREYDPIVSFDVPQRVLDELYDRDPVSKAAIRMGDHGLMTVTDLGHEAVNTRFLPAFAHRAVSYADSHGLTDADALAVLSKNLEFWLVGIA